MNFALILFLLTLATGVLWAFDRWVAGKRRPEGAPAPWWVEYGASFFPVILAVFALRSFVVEPFKIPSGSMIPTLLVGDFILVDKFSYGIRLPLLNRVVIPVGHPQRGEVMVFRYPADPSVDYIKRVVGLPGDYVEYLDKKLRINGVPVQYDPLPDYFHPDRLYYSTRWREHLGEHPHDILVDDVAPPFVTQRLEFPYADQLRIQPAGSALLRAARPLFRHGRQSRRQQRQPGVGLRAGGKHRRQGLLHLAEPLRPVAHRSNPMKGAQAWTQ